MGSRGDGDGASAEGDRAGDGGQPRSATEPLDPDLRTSADDCVTCSACDAGCPVASVDADFPGPKALGPQQWRLHREEAASDRADPGNDEGTAADSPAPGIAGEDVDASIMDCSNCMRCDDACPAGVDLSAMHNRARAAYVSEELSTFSRQYWRNRALANFRTLAGVASRVPRLSTALANNRAVRWLGERVFGVTAEREAPAFATRTFREWWAERGGAAASRARSRAARADGRQPGDSLPTAADLLEDGDPPDDGDQFDADPLDAPPADKRVAYFHGCYANFVTPAVARATVRAFEQFGYAVVVPEQDCSGTPMFANGHLDDARSAAETNVDALATLADRGYDAVCSCTSCSFAIRREYPELFDLEDVERVATGTSQALAYLRRNEDVAAAIDRADPDVEELPADALAYHAPCHARSQGLAGQAREILEAVPELTVTDVGDSCSGISGTYGWKAEKYDASMAVGDRMFDELDAADAEDGLTECPTCAMQMEHGTDDPVHHPIEVLAAALGEA